MDENCKPMREPFWNEMDDAQKIAALQDAVIWISRDFPANAPDDDSDRAKVIAQIEACADQEVAAIALDGARGKAWYSDAEAAYLEKFGG